MCHMIGPRNIIIELTAQSQTAMSSLWHAYATLHHLLNRADYM